MARRISDMFTEHTHYVEPFAGSLAVLLAKKPSKHETVNDLDGAIINFWTVLRDRPEDLIRACRMTPYSRAEWARCAEFDTQMDPIERARMTWVRLSQGRPGRLRRSSWRHYVDPAACRVDMPVYLSTLIDRMANAAQRMSRVALECLPAVDVIRKYGARDNVLLYVDPPYDGQAISPYVAYRHLMTHDEHRDLARALFECRATVFLSGYRSDLYDALYKDWQRVEFNATTGHRGSADKRVECIWTNRGLP